MVRVDDSLGVRGQGVGVSALPNGVRAEGEMLGSDEPGVFRACRRCGNAQMEGVWTEGYDACAEASLPVTYDG